MRIEAVDAVPVSVPVETPLQSSRTETPGTGHRDTYDRVLVVVETDVGVSGVGEIAPMPTWPRGLTRDACAAILDDEFIPVLEDRRVHRIPRIIEGLEATVADEPFPVCGVDMALYDALGKHRDLPVYELLGGPKRETRRIDLHYSIGLEDPDRMRSEAETASEAGHTDFKVKVGTDPERERVGLRTIREVIPDARIRVDANGAWTADEAVREIRALDDAADGLVFVEQPVSADDRRGMRRVREAVDPPILADEACFSPADVAAIANLEAADIVNIKLAKAGGLHRAGEVATVARAHGMAGFMGSMLELGVGTAASAHFAVASPAVTYPTGIFNTRAEHALIESDDEWEPDGASVVVPDRPGFGISLDDEAIEQYRTD